jgi:hypothetical protein
VRHARAQPGAWLVAAALATTSAAVRADGVVPPWIAEGDVAPPSWARSVSPKASPDPGEGGRLGDLALFAGPSRGSGKRGVTAAGASFPFFGERRGSGCSSPWWLVGPLAWTCADDAELSPVEPSVPTHRVDAHGLSASYFFVGPKGADAYDSLEAAEDGSPNHGLDGSWGVAITRQEPGHGDPTQRWGLTSHGLWIAMSSLIPARPSPFHGEAIADGKLDFAWVMTDRAGVWPAPQGKGPGLATTTATKGMGKPIALHARFDRVSVLEEGDAMVRVGDGAFMLARDLARPNLAAPPADVVRPGEHWIDVDRSTQTLVAYEGVRPVYATLVSTGRGAPGTSSATPPGIHRVWVKILASDMGNTTRDDEEHYSLEDVPYVQFFDSAVALHGTYWHGDFGHVRSHGCVNLSPLDAQWMFAFTEPHLPAGWVAVYPTTLDEGTVVRVR